MTEEKCGSCMRLRVCTGRVGRQRVDRVYVVCIESFSSVQLASVPLVRLDGPPFCSHGSVVWTPHQ